MFPRILKKKFQVGGGTRKKAVILNSPHYYDFYVHPESPATGAKWMAMKEILFDKIDIVANSTPNSSNIYIRDKRLYRVSFHIIAVSM